MAVHAPSTIVFIATAWGAKRGGLNSFNTALVSAIAKAFPLLRLCCVTISATEQEYRSAGGFGIELIDLQKTGEDNYNLDWAADVISSNDLGKVEWWVGHDIFTLPFALQLRASAKSGRVAVFMHASFSDYSHVDGDSTKADPRSLEQRKIFPKADRHFAVGPLLHDRLGDMVGPDVRRIDPGMTEVYHTRTGSHLDAIVFGRLKWEDHDTKQLPLAVRGFAAATKLLPSGVVSASKLTIVGLANDSAETRQKIGSALTAWAGRKLSLKIHGFIEDQELLRQLLQGKNACLFTSWHDGFGLGAWESIGAGIPLVLSRNTGVYRLLSSLGHNVIHRFRSVNVEHGVNLSDSDTDSNPDVKQIAEAMLDIGSNLVDSLSVADELRNLMLENFTWTHAAFQFIQALDLPFDGSPHMQRIFSGPRISVAEEMVTLSVAETQYKKSNYIRAREFLAEIPIWSISNRYKALLLDAKISLRLNEHDTAIEMSTRAAARFFHTADYCGYIEARGVENTVLRAFGRYAEALAISQQMIEQAKSLCPRVLCGAYRDHARTLALSKQIEDALHFARMALDGAGEDLLPRAKAQLAIGEALRHGMEFDGAITAYQDAINLATRAGHPDCLLWSWIALADAQQCLNLPEDALKSIQAAERVLGEPGRTYPIETLHVLFSRAILEGNHDLLDDYITRYEKIGVPWPRVYRDAVVSKRNPGPKFL